jgi:hypothetical protein
MKYSEQELLQMIHGLGKLLNKLAVYVPYQATLLTYKKGVLALV